MTDQDRLNYQRISEAIAYIAAHYQEQPNLEEIAASIHLSPHHFHRIFTDWSGTTPKKFVQYLSLTHAKKLLRQNQATLFDSSQEIGLSGTGRLHDLFVKIEGMTPAVYKNGGAGLEIKYSFGITPFGPIIIASTTKGICYLAFIGEWQVAFEELKGVFPSAAFIEQRDLNQVNILSIFDLHKRDPDEIRLHLRGTPFQLKVWEALLKIPASRTTSYGTIAKMINQPGAARAVGSAVGKNPVAYLIPCHRVIRASGIIGDYRWGSDRKRTMLGWETLSSSD